MKKLILILTFLFSLQFALSEGADSSSTAVRLQLGFGTINANYESSAKWKLNYNLGMSILSNGAGVLFGYSSFNFGYTYDTQGVDDLFDIKVDKEIEFHLNSLELNLTYGNKDAIPFIGVVLLSGGQKVTTASVLPQIGLIVIIKDDSNDKIGLNTLCNFIYEDSKHSYLGLRFNLTYKL